MKQKKTKKFPDTDFDLMMTRFDLYLLMARVSYIMANPTDFLNINLYYDLSGKHQHWFPKEVHTTSKIVITIQENRDVFSSIPGETLLDEFKKLLLYLCDFIKLTSMPIDVKKGVVGLLLDMEGKNLGYYYEEKYVIVK